MSINLKFRDAMSRLGAAVNVITTDGKAGRHGFTASAVCSVTDTPPTLLVCVNRSATANQLLKDNGVLCVNILACEQGDISNCFASSKKSAHERFSGSGNWRVLETGSPVLEQASAVIDCRISDMKEVGSHTVFFCEALEIAVGEQAEGLVYFNRAYHNMR
jgi:flavin reductase